MKKIFVVMLFVFAGKVAWGMTITNQTNEKIWCSSLCVQDVLPVEAMTQGWWMMENGATISIGPADKFVCNAYYCKGQSGKFWTEKKSGVQMNACVDFNRSPFKIFRANQADECNRLGATTVTYGLMNPDAIVRLVP